MLCSPTQTQKCDTCSQKVVWATGLHELTRDKRETFSFLHSSLESLGAEQGRAVGSERGLEGWWCGGYSQGSLGNVDQSRLKCVIITMTTEAGKISKVAGVQEFTLLCRRNISAPSPVNLCLIKRMKLVSKIFPLL